MSRMTKKQPGVNGGSAKKDTGPPKPAAKKRPPDAPPSPVERAEARLAETRAAFKRAEHEALERLRGSAITWLSLISYTLSALVDEVSRIDFRCEQENNLLVQVLDHKKLRGVHKFLEAAEQEAQGLRKLHGCNLGLPDLSGAAEKEKLSCMDAGFEMIEANNRLRDAKKADDAKGGA